MAAGVYLSLDSIAAEIKQRFGHAPDLQFRRMPSCLIVYLESLVDEQRLEREIISPIASRKACNSETITIDNLQETEDFEFALNSLLKGMVVIAQEGIARFLMANAILMPQRSIGLPQTENVLQGPHEGLTELMSTNVALIRRRLPSEKLRMKVFQIGNIVQTEVRLLFLEGITPDHIVEELTKRLSAIKIDSVIESNTIDELIKDHPRSIFPTMQITERPDIVTASLLVGKIVILTNNSPYALIAPFTFWTAFQSAEDYYINYNSATFLRLIRTIFISLSLFLPSLYVAITTFHPEMLPLNLLSSFTAMREASPFPAVIEAFFMEVTFEALREAAIRLPKLISQTVSIVGGLVIGQAIVQANIISTPMIIVVSITGIASLTIPRYPMTYPIRILRFMLLLLAGTFGLFGILFGSMIIGIYLTGLTSVGMPYLAPISPFQFSVFRDILVRAPHWILGRRQDANNKIKFEQDERETDAKGSGGERH